MRTRSAIDRRIAPIVQTIVQGYRPERVILFGSLASRRARTGRDVDLLVIKRTKKNPWVRLAELDQWLDHRVPIDALVYTPTEVEQRLRLGDDFLRTIMHTGRVVYEKAS